MLVTLKRPAPLDVDLHVEADGDTAMLRQHGEEVLATAERSPLSRTHLDDLLELAAAGIDQLRAAQNDAIAAAAASR